MMVDLDPSKAMHELISANVTNGKVNIRLVSALYSVRRLFNYYYLRPNNDNIHRLS